MYRNMRRRQFLKRVALGIGSFIFLSESSKGANERIGIGIIGAGGRGQDLMREVYVNAKDMNAKVVAICDVWRLNRESAVAKAKEWFGIEPRSTSDYQELLSWDEVDAVIIATPDFSHARILVDSVRAGKDAYCEKPLANTLQEAKEALKAVNETKRIVQVGTQRRSDGYHKSAVEVVRSGVLGKISRIVISFNFNHPRWRRDAKVVREEDVDWKRFLMHLPYRPFDPVRFLCWQLYREFSTGIPGLWMSHFIDVVHWFTDDHFPKSAVSHGGIYVWNDGREHADTFHSLLDYPSGFLVSFSMSLCNSAGNTFTIHGTNGTLDCMRWRLSGEGGAGAKKIQEEIQLKPKESISHVRNWVECIRNRTTPNAPIEAGYAHSVACILAAQAYWTGKRWYYDAQKQEMYPQD